MLGPCDEWRNLTLTDGSNLDFYTFTLFRGDRRGARNPSVNAHIPGLSYTLTIGSGRAGMIETAFRKECETGLFGELVVLGAAVEVRLFGQPTEGAA